MGQMLNITPSELKECVARAVGRILKEEVAKGEPLNENLLAKIKDIMKKYGPMAALGIATLTLQQCGVRAEQELDKQVEEHYDDIYNPTYDNGALDSDEYVDDDGMPLHKNKYTERRYQY